MTPATLKREPAPDWRDEDRQYLLSIFRPGNGPQAQAQRALAEWIDEVVRPHIFVTVQFLEQITVESARHRLRVISATAERHWLGQDYWKKPYAERSLFVAFLEEEAGTHWHILWRLPPAVQKTPLRELQAFLPAIVRHKIAPDASVDVQDLRQNEEFLRVITYSLKESYGQYDDPGRFVISTEFYSARRRALRK